MVATLAVLSLISATSDVIYVSPGRLGDDKNEGKSLLAPLKTVTAALAKKSGVIRLMDGEYPPQKWEIKDRKLTFEAAIDANPRLKSLEIISSGSEITLVSLDSEGKTDIKGSNESHLTLKLVRGRADYRFSGWARVTATDCRWTKGMVSALNVGGNQNRNSVSLSFNRCASTDSPRAAFDVRSVGGIVRWDNCLIARNAGAGLFLSQVTRADVNYCTFAGGKGTALDVDRTSLAIRNSIIEAPSGKWQKGTGIATDYNLYSGGDSERYGENDLVGDPKFGLALAGRDLQSYRPLSTSPALRASDPRRGINDDLTGAKRTGRPDLGCLQVSR